MSLVIGVYFAKRKESGNCSIAIWDRTALNLREPIESFEVTLPSNTSTNLIEERLEEIRATYPDEEIEIRHKTRVAGHTTEELRAKPFRRTGKYQTSELTESIALAIESYSKRHDWNCQAVQGFKGKDNLKSYEVLFEEVGLPYTGQNERNALMVAIGATKGKYSTLCKRLVKHQVRLKFGRAVQSEVSRRLAALQASL